MNQYNFCSQYDDKFSLKVSVLITVIYLNTVNQSLFNTYVYLFNSSVHGFNQTTDLVLTEGATQEVIRMTLDIKGSTITEPGSTRVLNFGFSFTCIDSSNGGGPQAVGELCVLGETLHLRVV